jgi:ABC-type multidrug transport system ATPase subunit
LFHDAILRLRDQGKTIIFVTHALHFLPLCDYIYILKDGRISEQGTYKELINSFGNFAGPGEFARASSDDDDNVASKELKKDVQEKSAIATKRAAGTGRLEGKLIVKEARSTGCVSYEGQR